MRAAKQATAVRREQIATAALSIVASQGLSAMTVARVARLVGLTPSALYRHYAGKVEIMDAVLDLLRNRILGNVAAAGAAPNGLEALHTVLMRQVALVLEFSAIPRVLFSEEVYGREPALKAKLHDLLQSLVAGLAGLAKRGQEEGCIRKDITPQSAALLLFGAFQPCAMLWYLSGGTFDLAVAVAENWELYRKAVAAR
jgi:AcrR family transcriptional regulator